MAATPRPPKDDPPEGSIPVTAPMKTVTEQWRKGLTSLPSFSEELQQAALSGLAVALAQDHPQLTRGELTKELIKTYPLKIQRGKAERIIVNLEYWEDNNMQFPLFGARIGKKPGPVGRPRPKAPGHSHPAKVSWTLATTSAGKRAVPRTQHWTRDPTRRHPSAAPAPTGDDYHGQLGVARPAWMQEGSGRPKKQQRNSSTTTHTPSPASSRSDRSTGTRSATKCPHAAPAPTGDDYHGQLGVARPAWMQEGSGRPKKQHRRS
jgi:hypothetical protein